MKLQIKPLSLEEIHERNSFHWRNAWDKSSNPEKESIKDWVEENPLHNDILKKDLSESDRVLIEKRLSGAIINELKEAAKKLVGKKVVEESEIKAVSSTYDYSVSNLFEMYCDRLSQVNSGKNTDKIDACIELEEKCVLGDKCYSVWTAQYYYYLVKWWNEDGLATNERENRAMGEFNMSFNGTSINSIAISELNIRFLKTLFPTFKDMLAGVGEDFDFYTLSTIEDNGTVRLQSFRNVPGGNELSSIFMCAAPYILVEQVYDQLEPLSIDEIMGQYYNGDELNHEQRAALFTSREISLSLKNVLNLLDTYVDKRDADNHKMYRLYKSNPGFLGVDEPIQFVNCFCPSTDREFMLPCDGSVTNAKDAVASLLRVPVDLKPHIVEMHRQGEIFVVKYDIKDTDPSFKKKAKSKREPFTGEEYFKLLSFES